ncbi:MAG: biotin--[acetyl-CoA-carboxylase] ligase [Planctomycetia bacterium]|nr:biotin--[acetyl-CoA-carboxylase] ligase [Planctomycetia bacterium]
MLKNALRLHFLRIDSTNTVARRLADEGRLPALVTAERQTAGRGKGARVWHSPKGCLMFSFVFDRTKYGISLERSPLLSSVAALAIVDALGTILSPTNAKRSWIHWPNDIYVSAESGGEGESKFRKLCGILTEGLPNGVVLHGIGLNFWNRTSDAPPDLVEKIVSLCEVEPNLPSDSVEEFLTRFLTFYEEYLALLASAPEQISAKMNALCVQKGRQIALETPQGRVVGMCRGIALDGGIIIDDKIYYCGEDFYNTSR